MYTMRLPQRYALSFVPFPRTLDTKLERYSIIRKLSPLPKICIWSLSKLRLLLINLLWRTPSDKDNTLLMVSLLACGVCVIIRQPRSAAISRSRHRLQIQKLYHTHQIEKGSMDLRRSAFRPGSDTRTRLSSLPHSHHFRKVNICGTWYSRTWEVQLELCREYTERNSYRYQQVPLANVTR